MSKLISKWYISLIVAPLLLTYISNYFTRPVIFEDWKLAIIFSLVIALVILIIELKILSERLKKTGGIKSTDKETINKLLHKLDTKMFQYDVGLQDSWNGYRSKAIHKITDYQYESQLFENKIINKDLEVLVNNFNAKLELFTDFSSCNLYGVPSGFLIPFKDSANREKIKKTKK